MINIAFVATNLADLDASYNCDVFSIDQRACEENTFDSDTDLDELFTPIDHFITDIPYHESTHNHLDHTCTLPQRPQRQRKASPVTPITPEKTYHVNAPRAAITLPAQPIVLTSHMLAGAQQGGIRECDPECDMDQPLQSHSQPEESRAFQPTSSASASSSNLPTDHNNPSHSQLPDASHTNNNAVETPTTTTASYMLTQCTFNNNGYNVMWRQDRARHENNNFYINPVEFDNLFPQGQPAGARKRSRREL